MPSVPSVTSETGQREIWIHDRQRSWEEYRCSPSVRIYCRRDGWFRSGKNIGSIQRLEENERLIPIEPKMKDWYIKNWRNSHWVIEVPALLNTGPMESFIHRAGIVYCCWYVCCWFSETGNHPRFTRTSGATHSGDALVHRWQVPIFKVPRQRWITAAFSHIQVP